MVQLRQRTSLQESPEEQPRMNTPPGVTEWLFIRQSQAQIPVLNNGGGMFIGDFTGTPSGEWEVDYIRLNPNAVTLIPET